MSLDWSEEYPFPVTVCNRNGTILYMNQALTRQFADEGGAHLVGTNLLDCHPEPARSKLAGLLQTGASNLYTIDKNGQRKVIVQAPWQQDGQYAGLVEISIPLPADLAHFNRDQPA
jgi:hypothetical protein